MSTEFYPKTDLREKMEPLRMAQNIGGLPVRGYGFIEIPTTPNYEEFSVSSTQPTFVELEKPLGTKIIDMDDRGHVTAKPGEYKRIGTYGLCGCTAVGVTAKFPDGSTRAYVQHYSPFGKRINPSAKSLEELALDAEASEGNYKTASKISAVVMIPGEYEIQVGKHILVPQDNTHASWLGDALKDSFGLDTAIIIAPYRMYDDGNTYSNTLIVDIPVEGSPTIQPGLEIINI